MNDTLKIGDRVLVKSGSFYNYEGYVRKITKDGYVCCDMEICGRKVSVEFNYSALEKNPDEEETSNNSESPSDD